MRHLISPLDLSVEETEEILLLAEDIAKDPSKYSEVCKGKKIATLFYEPSTRTRLSFEAADDERDTGDCRKTAVFTQKENTEAGCSHRLCKRKRCRHNPRCFRLC